MTMNKALMLATVLFFGVAGQAAAQGDACPTRETGEGGKAFNGRTHDYCEAQWSDMVAAKQAGGQTHDRFINLCARKCIGDLGARTVGSQISPLGYGLAAAGMGGVIAGAVGTGASGGFPSSP